MRPAYCARTQSSLKRLATNKVTLEKSSETCAVSGLIQVLNCCCGSSCANWSMHACHKLSPAPSAAPVARLLCCPSLILRCRPCGYFGSRKAADSSLSKRYPQRAFGDEAQQFCRVCGTRAK